MNEWRRPLIRKVSIILVIKLVAVFLLFMMFFGPSQRPDINPETVERHLRGGAP